MTESPTFLANKYSLTELQLIQNCKLDKNTRDMVERAIRIQNGANGQKMVINFPMKRSLR